MADNRGRTGRLATQAAIVLLAAMGLAVLLAPLLAPYGEADFVGEIWAPPSAEFWLGTDNLGRDMFSRLLYGGQASIGVTLLATAAGFAIGIVFGFAAAVAPRWLDNVLSRLVDTVMSVPELILALVVLSVLGTSIPVLVGIIAFLDSTRVFRLCRLLALRINSLEFVEAARLRGERLPWILGREILPNAWPPLLAEFGIRFSFTLLFVASLSFLGLGIQPPHTDWGGMVRDNAPALTTGSLAPFVPAAAIALVAVCVNLVVDRVVGEREAPEGP